MPEFDRLEIQHFFEVYKELEPGKSVEGASWVGRAEAEAEIARSIQRLKDNPDALEPLTRSSYAELEVRSELGRASDRRR